jgi:hypothetical protein
MHNGLTPSAILKRALAARHLGEHWCNVCRNGQPMRAVQAGRRGMPEVGLRRYMAMAMYSIALACILLVDTARVCVMTPPAMMRKVGGSGCVLLADGAW